MRASIPTCSSEQNNTWGPESPSRKQSPLRPVTGPIGVNAYPEGDYLGLEIVARGSLSTSDYAGVAPVQTLLQGIPASLLNIWTSRPDMVTIAGMELSGGKNPRTLCSQV
jgi:hypothetical protein